VLLLNFVRVVITLLGLGLVETFRLAYDLDGFPLLAVLGLVLFIVFVVGDVAEEKLVDYFNPDN